MKNDRQITCITKIGLDKLLKVSVYMNITLLQY